MTINLELNSKKNKDGLYGILIRITENKKHKRVKSGVFVSNAQFNKKAKFGQWIRQAHPKADDLNKELEAKILELKENYNIGGPMDSSGLFNKGDFFSFANKFIERYNRQETLHTYVKYNVIIKKLKVFNNDRALPFSQANYTFFDRFLQDLVKNKLSSSTIAHIFSKLKAIWNAAIRSGDVGRLSFPFYDLKIPKPKPAKKEKLTKEELNKIRKLSLEEGTNIWHARNTFLFAFNCMGIRAGDLVTLKVKDVKRHRLEYRMRKTADPISVSLSNEAKGIYDYYVKGKRPEDFLFPWYEKINPKLDDWRRRNTAVCLINKYVKELPKAAEIDKKVTTHIARHSWAYQAKISLVDKKLIRQALGHEKDETTEHYLASFPDEMMDEANRRVVGD